MPMVTMPDGALVEMPDNPSAEQLARLKAVQQAASSPFVKGAKDIGSAAIRGVGRLPALILDLMAPSGAIDASIAQVAAGREPSQELDEIAKGKLPFGASKAVDNFGTKAAPGSGMEMASAGIEGVTGNLVPGMGLAGAAAAPIRTGMAGAGGGLGAELAKRLFPDNAAAPIIGGLAGGTGAGMVGNFAGGVRPQTKQLAQQAVEGLTPEMLEKAKMVQAMARSRGVDLDLAQALGAAGLPSTNLSTIRDILAQNSAGNKTQAMLRAQPQQFQAQAELQMMGLPGATTSPTEAANAVQSGTTKVVKNAKDARSNEVRGLYAAAGDLPPSVRKEMADILSEFASQPGRNEQAVSAASKGQETLKKAPSTQAPMLHALDYDAMIRDVTGSYKNNLNPVDAVTEGQLKMLAGELNRKLKDSSPELAAAESKFAQISNEIVNPLKKSVVGRFATRRGAQADVEASAAKLDSLFSAGVDPSSKVNDIAVLAKELNGVDKEAFPNAVNTWLSGRLARSAEPELNAVEGASWKVAENVYNQLYKDKAKFHGLKTMIEGVADAYNLPRENLVKGFEDLGQVAKAVSNRPERAGGIDKLEVFKKAGDSRVADALRFFGFAPFNNLANKVNDKQIAATFGKFDELLTSKDGAKILAEIGKKGWTPETYTMLAGFRGGLVSATGINNSAGSNQ